MKTSTRWISIALLLLVVFVALFNRPYLIDHLHLPTRIKEAALPNFTVGERTLIIAPHPDDETLGGGGVIEKAIRAGKQVKVVIMTTGDGYESCVKANFHVEKPGPADFRRLGEARHLESIAAMQHFGVPAENVMFLGYPDGGINGMWEHNWDADNLHKGLNGAIRAPYSFAYEANAPYCGANVIQNLTDIIQAYHPTDIVYPDPNDQHHDHWAANAFVKHVLTEQHIQVKEWTYLVHRGDYPIPWMYKPNLSLTPPYVLRDLDTRWLTVPMEEQEREIKRGAISAYTTQRKVMEHFLDAFVRKNELLGTYTDPLLPTTQEPFDLQKEPDESPYMLFHDAYADTLERKVVPGADLIALGALQAGDSFYLGLEAKGVIAPEIRYVMRARIFRTTGVDRFDLNVLGDKVTDLHDAHNSLTVPKGTTVHHKGNRLWIKMPASVLDGCQSLLVSADTFGDKSHIDKSAWRLIIKK